MLSPPVGIATRVALSYSARDITHVGNRVMGTLVFLCCLLHQFCESFQNKKSNNNKISTRKKKEN